MPKVSFVLPVKNGEAYIKHTVDSLLNQTVKNIEIVVVDDHSSDKTIEILNEIKDRRLTILSLKSKTGVSAARNMGTERSTGEIILPSDADDPNFPNRAEISIKELELAKADIFYSNLERYFENTKKRELRHFQPYDPIILRNINFIAHAGSSAYYRYVFDKVGGYDESIKIGEDYDFWLTAQEKDFKFCFKNIALAQYTMHNNQITSTNSSSRIKERQKWNRIIRKKHGIFTVEKEYISAKATPEVMNFYMIKNREIWFGKESIPTRN